MTTNIGLTTNGSVDTGALGIQTENLVIDYSQSPFTIEFDITRNITNSANVAQIRIYNLSENNRNKIRFNIQDSGLFLGIQLKAGYGSNLPIIFTGNMSQAWSIREGSDFITYIECFDGGYAFANGQTNEVFPAGMSEQTVLQNLSGSLPKVSVGAIGNYSGTLARNTPIAGNTTQILNERTGGGFFIDNGTANCLGQSECLNGEMALINSASGLLGTPLRERTSLNFDVVFEPRPIPGQQIQLQSSTDANFNGFYKITSVKHRGMISPAVCGQCITSIGLFYGVGALQLVGSVL